MEHHRKVIRISFSLALCISSFGHAAASDLAPTGEEPMTRMDLTRCMSHIERASHAALMRQAWVEDATKAMRCNGSNTSHLSDEQREQMQLVYELFHLQTEAPSVSVNGQIIMEIQRFLSMIR